MIHRFFCFSKLTTSVLFFAVLFFSFADTGTGKQLPNFLNTAWIEQGALKWGFLTATCAEGFFDGATESAQFGGHVLCSSDGENYHLWKTGRNLAAVAEGWFLYANIRDADLTGWGKARRIFGTYLIRRDFYEWSYRWNRYGNPFDYLPEHNRKAIVYFGFRGGRLTDLYIGTGAVTSPLVDILFAVTGAYLLR